MKQKIRIWLRNFFGFSRTETNGFIILNILLAVSLALPFLTKAILLRHNPSLQSEQDKENLAYFLNELESNLVSDKEDSIAPKYEEFDLNTSTVHALEKSGFPKFLAERIVKYREKVKPFEKKSDLLKIYGVDSSFYATIQPFIQVTRLSNNLEGKQKETIHKRDTTENRPFLVRKPKKEILRVMDINKVDSIQLQKIYGIGPAFSSRIIKYRDYLGGFHSINQLSEIYGLKKENLDSLKKYVSISRNSSLKKLKVNTLNADSLVQHPYISYREANLIINFRNQHGKFDSPESLLQIKVLDSSWLQKIKPYFIFD